MSFLASVPILPSRDLPATSAFYARLGFTQRGLWPKEKLILELGAVELHFFHSTEHDPATSSFMCYLRAQDTQRLHAEYATLGITLGCAGWPRVQGPPDADGEFAVVDPDGTLLRIGRPRRERG